MSLDTQTVLDEMNSVWEQMKAANDEAKGEYRESVRRMNDRLDQLEIQQKRLPTQSRDFDPTAPHAQDMRLFFKAIALDSPANITLADERAKAQNLIQRAIERKALVLGDDTTGGFLALPEFSQEIVRGIQLISPVRQYARVRNTSKRSVQIPVRSGTFSAQWTGETALRTETTGLSVSMDEVTPQEMYAEVIVSNQDLDDSEFDLAAFIAEEAREQFAKAEGTAFVNGDGVKKPEGFMTRSGIASDNSGNASALTADGLITFLYNLKEGYARNATWFLNRKSIGAIRLLKDSQNRYLWEPNYQAGTPPTILGVPYAEVPDMPDVAGNAFPIALGDWRKAYQIVDRIDVTVQKLVELHAYNNQVGFLIRKRVGGQVILPEAIRLLKIA